tara:strand:+ start:341 stop:550 length:210 start_codon:yes stop_codon:yes gene_type:complete
MNERDKDIITVLKAVLDIQPSNNYSSNGNWSTCPFCYNHVNYETDDIKDITHLLTCPYLIAKDLTTNII